MVEEGFAFVGGGEGVDGGEEAKVEGEEVRVGGVGAFLKGGDNQLRVSMEMAIGVDVPKIGCKFHSYDGCFIFGLIRGVEGDGGGATHLFSKVEVEDRSRASLVRGGSGGTIKEGRKETRGRGVSASSRELMWAGKSRRKSGGEGGSRRAGGRWERVERRG